MEKCIDIMKQKKEKLVKFTNLEPKNIKIGLLVSQNRTNFLVKLS